MSRASESSSNNAPRAGRLRLALEFTGVVPLLVYVLLHLLDLTLAIRAEQGFESMMARSRFDVGLEVLLLWLPLAAHSALGLWQLATERERRERFGPKRLARASALVLVVFVVVHVATLRAARAGGSLADQDVFYRLIEQLSSTTSFGIPTWALGYTLGVVALGLHVGLSLRAFADGRGWLSHPRLGRPVRVFTWVLGVLLLLWGLDVVAVYATGSHFWLAPV